MGTLADHIETYIKEMLQGNKNHSVEISRSQLADYFSCVPSQINYVLTTRFTIERGYVVESRRGGGGYIRIARLQRNAPGLTVEDILGAIGESIDEKRADSVLATMMDLALISERDAKIVKGIIQQEISGVVQGKEIMRSSLLRAALFILLYTKR